jgi:hypothetical protein
VGLLGFELARRCGLEGVLAGVGGLIAGALTLWPTFLSNYMALGFDTSIFAGLLLAVSALEVVGHAGTTRSVLVTAVAGTLVMHSWQLLAPASGVAFAAAWLYLRGLRSVARLGVLMVAVAGAALLAWPGAVAVVAKVGIRHASDADVVAPLPYGFLAVGLVAVVALCLRCRGTSTGVLAAMVLVNAM